MSRSCGAGAPARVLAAPESKVPRDADNKVIRVFYIYSANARTYFLFKTAGIPVLPAHERGRPRPT